MEKLPGGEEGDVSVVMDQELDQQGHEGHHHHRCHNSVRDVPNGARQNDEGSQQGFSRFPPQSCAVADELNPNRPLMMLMVHICPPLVCHCSDSRFH